MQKRKNIPNHYDSDDGDFDDDKEGERENSFSDSRGSM